MAVLDAYKTNNIPHGSQRRRQELNISGRSGTPSSSGGHIPAPATKSNKRQPAGFIDQPSQPKRLKPNYDNHLFVNNVHANFVIAILWIICKLFLSYLAFPCM